MISSIFLLLIAHVLGVQKFYTQSTANTFGDFSLGAGYDINRYEPKATHLFKEGSDDILYDIMPITSTKTRCALVTSQKDIGDKLFVHGAMSISYNMITGSGEITYDQKKETMSKVAYYTCTVDRTLYTISVNAPQTTNLEGLIPENILALADESDSEKAKEKIIDVVGEYHIRSITYGRRYNTEIRVEYSTEDAFEKISGKLEAEIGVGALSVSAEVQVEADWNEYAEDLTFTVGSEALGFVEAEPLFLPSKDAPKLDENGLPMRDNDSSPIVLTPQEQIDNMIQKNLEAFNQIDANKTMKPRTGLNKSQLFEFMDDAYPLWYTVEKNYPYFGEKLDKLSPYQEARMLRNLDQAYEIMRELEDMTENIETRAELLFDSYHLLSGATNLSMEFLEYRQNLLEDIVAFREEVSEYIKLPPTQKATKDIYRWAAEDEEIEHKLEYVSIDILHTKVWDLLGMEDVPMEHESEIGATCVFNGIQATIGDTTNRRKFAGRVVFGDLTVRHVLFDIDGKVVSLGYIDHEHDNRNNEAWTGDKHELVFVREDCTLLKNGSDVWYQDSRYTVTSIGSDEHLTSRGYVNKEKLTSIRIALRPKDVTRNFDVIITEEQIMDVELRGYNINGFHIDDNKRLLYKHGYVCDHGFQKYEANMICTTLGFEDALDYQVGVQIPATNAWDRPHITMTDLDCRHLARDLGDCTYKSRDDMDAEPSTWNSCKTGNGVELTCENSWKPKENAFRMDVVSESVSCARNEDAMNEFIDTAAKCSGVRGDEASNFGHVDEVIVEGSICVKLFDENNQLECVVPENDAPWDFRNTETVMKFCYDESLSDNLLHFPETIQMISKYRHEECADDETKLKQADFEYIVNYETAVKLETCKLGKEAGLCDKDRQIAESISIEDSHLDDFNNFCEKTCGHCVASDREHFIVTVDPSTATFAMNGSEEVPVKVTIDSEPLQFDKYSSDKLSFKREFECGEKIQIKVIPQKRYDHGLVTCSIKMAKETQDARVGELGIVVIGGDIEVTFECFNPPSFAPTVLPSEYPTTTYPTSEYPTTAPTALSQNDCILDLIGLESYCAKSSTEDCDGTTCTELARSNTQSWNECISTCRGLESCQYISGGDAGSDMIECVMYDECPALKQKNDTATVDVCKRADARFETFHSLEPDISNWSAPGMCIYVEVDNTECPGMADHLIRAGYTSGACPATHKKSHCDGTREFDLATLWEHEYLWSAHYCNSEWKHLAFSYACVEE